MADNILNITEISDSLNHALINSISPLVTIFKIVGIALLVYIIFLILKALFRWKTMTKVSKMAKDVEQINEKMDVLIEKIDKLGKKETKSEEVEVKEEKKGLFKRFFGKSEDNKSEKIDKKIKKGKNKSFK
jgi:hypothetical protein